ncbi:eukaryotic translation initiation factor 4E type 3-B [Tritrichomonas foetus]|uniref:Eukaryotic translation initiation factor 4E type 3-B n=1 Tax=Tritrichomonas foetus TaxID=1144522 RepID=A0A1J4KNT7_9EUKA|nr:eukaryotic translation initiation factor 4E type 3-B [Tritrichomonas foetus]|eukprot:OHT12951.1 eukaryotic translation initiation factor 4E type 3-B [Tritrichomonas foetus]
MSSDKKWTFWLVILDFTTGQSRYTIEEIGTVNTLDNLYQYYKTLPKMNEIKRNQGKYGSIGFFQNGIKPAWEDPNNKNGGSYEFLVKTEIVNDVWRDLLLVAFGGTIGNNNSSINDKICGIKISPKRLNESYMVEIWCKEGGETIADHVYDQLSKLPSLTNKLKKEDVKYSKYGQ